MGRACGGVRVYTCGGHMMVCVGVGMGAHVECTCGVHVVYVECMCRNQDKLWGSVLSYFVEAGSPTVSAALHIQ